MLEIEDRRISKELHSDEQSADRRLSFTAAIYNCLRYMWHVGDMSPQENFDLLVLLWGETARVGRPTANLVIAFETFKCSHNLKVWLRFAPRHGKIF